MQTAATPVRPGERIVTLDIVRGFALLGILIMNMPSFGASFFAEADGSHLFPDRLNRGVELARDMLFAGKFNSMFSMLFGLGFTLQLGRMMERAPGDARGLYLRRLLALLAIGLAHGMIFWTGDVLHIYALLGLLLLLLRRLNNRAVVGIIVACLVYPAVSGLVRMWVVTPAVVEYMVASSKAWEASNNLAYGHGSFLEAAREHAREFVFCRTDPMRLWGTLNFVVLMLTTTLLGFLVGRNGWVQRIGELMPRIRRIQWWALAVGLLCAGVFGLVIVNTKPIVPSLLRVLGSVAFVLSRLGLMSFYVLTIVRAAQKPAWQRRFAPLAAAGRMPLTNYLLETVISSSLFYGWGAGLWGSLGPAAELLLAIAIYFVILVPLSVLWLRRFDYGPMEYLWRVLTYGRRPAARGALSPAAAE